MTGGSCPPRSGTRISGGPAGGGMSGGGTGLISGGGASIGSGGRGKSGFEGCSIISTIAATTLPGSLSRHQRVEENAIRTLGLNPTVDQESLSVIGIKRVIEHRPARRRTDGRGVRT